MPALPEQLARDAISALDRLSSEAELVGRHLSVAASDLAKRINIPSNSTSPAGLIEANTRDPWNKSGKYALGMVYFCIILLVLSSLLRLYHLFTDKTRTALHQEEVLQSSKTTSPDTDYEMSVLDTDKSTNKFFPRKGQLPQPPPIQPTVSSFSLVNNGIALFRYIFYHPIPNVQTRRGWRPLVFPSLGVTTILLAALIFTTLYCFIPQPLYWQSIRFGSPPLAIRSGMLAVALMPWIIALSMKANFISLMTGIGHERLNVLHRWGGYLMLFLSLIHMIPFYVTPIWDDGGMTVWQSFVKSPHFYLYGTGWAAIVPLIFLCIHSLPQLRSWMYELFVAVHVPASMVFLGMLFWHCNNYLTSWNYLFATLAIWLSSYIVRIFFLNWTNPWRMSWLVGDEAAVTIMPENAIKVTIPTQTKWRPGQYVYLRMPGISVFENHPFTIASLCDKDFPSAYGEDYRDMVLVFRPFGGFTQKVLRSAVERGPWHTYRAFIDGPYGGMQRRIEAFDHVVLIAGGSGVTAIVSQLLDLIKRMRDGKAVTKSIQVVWALKRPETMEWFKEELRICREFAPPDSVQCQFYITAAKRMTRTGQLVSAQTPTRPVSMVFHDKVNNAFQDIADRRYSNVSSMKRHSALIHDEAQGDPAREKELRAENEDAISALPQAHILPISRGQNGPEQQQQQQQDLEHPSPTSNRTIAQKRRSRNLSIDLKTAASASPNALDPAVVADESTQQSFDFGFPSTPTEFQKNLMRFAFLPAAVKKKDGWSTEYGRPDIPYMLRGFSKDFGRRTCVFVCGPPGMRVDVSNTVAELQKEVLRDGGKDEIFLHAENYAI
ncbi:metalloreductase-like protein transmembrane component [Saccharata proteae CBS 121410]|uniref:ferric-chelate reductase (NADPH) n=1 Tax=Saccharata proteae CBS 121410 TaxID=1314787 RepID=A0A9P4HQJ1_9PEZI|nr:metalloreductase-like protein transmembrane component [Saccharata proteae CBS 121410]